MLCYKLNTIHYIYMLNCMLCCILAINLLYYVKLYVKYCLFYIAIMLYVKYYLCYCMLNTIFVICYIVC